MTDQGWFADPSGRHVQRWFDGQAWTDHVVGPAGDVIADPLPASPVPYGTPFALSGTTASPPPPGSASASSDETAAERNDQPADDQPADDQAAGEPSAAEPGPPLDPADEATVRRPGRLDVDEINQSGASGNAPSGAARADPPPAVDWAPAQPGFQPGYPPGYQPGFQPEYAPPGYAPPGYPPSWPPQPAGPYGAMPGPRQRVVPGAGLAAGIVGLICLVLSLFVLKWGDSDKSGFLDLGSNARKADTSHADAGPTVAIYFLAWGGWVLFALTVLLVVFAGIPIPQNAAGNTYARVAGSLVAGLGAIGQAIAVTQLFKGDPSPQFGAWLGLIGWLIAVVGFVLGARRVRPRPVPGYA